MLESLSLEERDEPDDDGWLAPDLPATVPPTKSYWIATIERHITSKRNGKERQCILVCEKHIGRGQKTHRIQDIVEEATAHTAIQGQGGMSHLCCMTLWALC